MIHIDTTKLYEDPYDRDTLIDIIDKLQAEVEGLERSRDAWRDKAFKRYWDLIEACSVLEERVQEPIYDVDGWSPFEMRKPVKTMNEWYKEITEE